MPRRIRLSLKERTRDGSASRNVALAASLYNSILEEDLNRIEYLLNHEGADPNLLLPQFGITPMHCSVGCGDEDHAFKAVSLTLFYGGNPNVRCSERTTPVSVAALWGRIHVLKLLIAHGGDPSYRDDDGLDAFDYAERRHHEAILIYLDSWRQRTRKFLSPSYSLQNDAITQTSLVSENSVSPIEFASDEFVSCLEDSFSESGSCRKITSGDNRMIHPLTSICSSANADYNSLNLETISVNRSYKSLIFEKGFICDNLSDLLSDIDIDLDTQHTVSIFNANNNSSAVLGNVDRQVVNESIISFSEESFACSQKDIAFVEEISASSSKPNEELYTDSKAGIVLLQRNFPPDLSDSDNNIDLSDSTSSYDTDNLTNKLKECKIFSGPITKTTKKVYTRKLKRFIKSDIAVKDEVSGKLGSVLTRTFSDNYLQLINQWGSLELTMNQDFLKNATNKFRGGAAKCFFNYLLLDPRKTDNLPVRASHMNPLDVWRTFIEAIFYVGKGKQSRPYAHLYEALKPNTRKPISRKVQKVLDIWKDKHGVICLMIFHNVVSAEALTREAAMIDVLEGVNLTNAQGGEYHGVAASWNMKQKCQLGAVLLHKALQIFLAEGERHLSPPDLEERPRFR